MAKDIWWGVYNYNTLWFIECTRKEAIDKVSNDYLTGGRKQYEKLRKEGAVRVVKVEVKETNQ